MMCLGIDIGFGFTKVYDGTNIMSFPSIVSNTIDFDGFSEKSCIAVDAEKFFIGDDVRGQEKWYDTRTADFVGSLPWIALLAGAIKGCSLPNMYKNALVLGIPSEQYDKGKAAELVDIIKRRYVHAGAGRIDLENTYISIVPQGFGIFLKYLQDNSIGSGYKTMVISVADIGFHTIDLITMDKGRYLDDYACSFPMGISVLLDEIRREFNKKYRFFIGREDAMKLMQNPHFESLGETFELKNVESITKKYAVNVATIINSYMEGHRFDVGIAGGGGVHLLRNLVKLKKKLSTVSEPAAANSIGYWLYGMEKYGKEQ
ncbi:MAG TPA: ParM/StbA family protein [Syntrophales bacterium]|nr:ParM/StbA family protein [Syntrophales bacterium]